MEEEEKREAGYTYVTHLEARLNWTIAFKVLSQYFDVRGSIETGYA